MTEISVHHEWGKLKEAVVGTAVGLSVPNWSDEYEFLTPEAQRFVKDSQGKRLKEADPELYEKSISQMDDFVALLESRGVVVYRPKPLTPDEEKFLRAYKAGIQQCFTRDPILVIGNNVIETSMIRFLCGEAPSGARITLWCARAS